MLIKLLIITLIVGLTPNTTLAINSKSRVRQEILKQLQDKGSTLNLKIQELIKLNKLPETSVFKLSNEESLSAGNKQEYSECTADICTRYERSFYTQLGDLRNTKVSNNGKVVEIRAWPIYVRAYVLKIWKTDKSGSLIGPIQDQVIIIGASFI